MGYFDAFTANLFHSDDLGRRFYAPFGKFGRSYLVPDEKVTPIATSIQTGYKVMLISIIGTQIIFGWRWNLLVGPLATLLVYFQMWRVTRTLEAIKVTELAQPSPKELLTKQAKATGSWALWSLLIISVLFTSVGVWMLATQGDSMAWFATVFFGLCALIFAKQLWLLGQARSSSDTA